MVCFTGSKAVGSEGGDQLFEWSRFPTRAFLIRCQQARGPFSVVFLFSNSPLRGLFPRFCFVPGSVRSSSTTTEGNYSGQPRQVNVDNINSPSVTVADPSFISFCVYCARAFVPTLRVAICEGWSSVVGGWVRSVSVSLWRPVPSLLARYSPLLALALSQSFVCTCITSTWISTSN